MAAARQYGDGVEWMELPGVRRRMGRGWVYRVDYTRRGDTTGGPGLVGRSPRTTSGGPDPGHRTLSEPRPLAVQESVTDLPGESAACEPVWTTWLGSRHGRTACHVESPRSTCRTVLERVEQTK